MNFTFRKCFARPFAIASFALLIPTVLFFSVPVSAQGTRATNSTVEKINYESNLRLAKSSASQPKSEPPQNSIRDAEREVAHKIHSALMKRTELKWEELPLNEAMKGISREFNIIIELDLMAIEDAGYSKAEKISVDAQGRTLFSTLKSAFALHGFTFVIVNEAMLITTNDAIDSDPERYLNLRVYKIPDLQIDSVEIMKLVQDQIDPQSWLETNGGPATVTPLQNGESQLLIISQTLLNHMKIESLLSDIVAASSK